MTISRRRMLSLTLAAAAGGLGGAAGCYRGRPPVAHDPGPPRPYYPAVVIGSGYGGGVSALRLGQHGVDTLVLEQGRYFNEPDADGLRFSKMLPPDTRAGWFTDRPPALVRGFRGASIEQAARSVPSAQPVQAGICDRQTHGDHEVFRGIGVGGGSLINAAIAAVPTADQVRAALPDIDPAEFLGTYVPRAGEQLRISYRDPDWFERSDRFQYARLARSYATEAGYAVDYNGSAYSFDYLRREELGEVPASALALEQQFGNNYGRIGSVDQTYIAAAQATGHVRVSPLTEALDIRREPSGEYVIAVRRIDRWGTEIGRHEIGCRHLVLCAGVLGTVKLLLRARDTGVLPDLSTEIGRGYGNNGDLMVAHDTSEPTGVGQSLMGMINVDGRADTDNPLYASAFAMPFPVETSLLGYYAMVRTADRADIGYDRATDSIRIDWRPEYTAAQVARAKAAFDPLLRINRADYRDDIFGGKVFAPNTVHPLGGCIRGRATDGFGRVKGYPNLYVNDGSLLPGYLGCNPFMTITALAERNIEAILQSRTDRPA